jgi:hypothetical protein
MPTAVYTQINTAVCAFFGQVMPQHLADMKRPKWSWSLFLVVVMTALCHGQTEKALTLVESAAVIFGLQQYFRSGCVFFLYSKVRTDYGEHTVRRDIKFYVTPYKFEW